MGHVNNAVIMEYFDLGKSEYFSSIGIPPETGDFTVMIVHFEVDFMSQIRYRDKVDVTTEVTRIGNKSITVEQHVVHHENGNDYAICRTVMAGYDRTKGCSAVIPDNLKPVLMQ